MCAFKQILKAVFIILFHKRIGKIGITHQRPVFVSSDGILKTGLNNIKLCKKVHKLIELAVIGILLIKEAVNRGVVEHIVKAVAKAREAV